MEEQEEENERSLSWKTARVVFGRPVGIGKNSDEITIETGGEDGERFEEDYDLPEDFAEDHFEELVDYLDWGVRVVLLDNMNVKILRSERQEA